MYNYQVLIPQKFDEPFDYKSNEEIAIGSFVAVEFGRKTINGVVWSNNKPQIADNKIKPITQIHNLPPISTNNIKLIKWLADYYMAPLGMVLKMFMSEKSVFTPPKKPDELVINQFTHNKPILNEQQQLVANELIAKTKAKQFSTNVLEGVTGSGKTEVYFEVIEQALLQNQQVLVLLPEIALSTQWVTRFEKRFGVKPANWNSGQTPKQKRLTWLGIANNKIKIVVGARSALFLPYQDLGLVVIDEEHDQSFKQSEGVVYNARDAAIVKAKYEGFAVILASATPSIETIVNTHNGKYIHHHLASRYGAAQMPDINLVDMCKAKLKKDKFISNALREAISHTISSGKQAMLYLNRRGFAPLTICRNCGHKYECPDTSAWLVQHKIDDQTYLKCHHSGYSRLLPDECDECGEKDTLHPCGPGVQRVYEEIYKMFPTARVAQMTSDNITTPKKAHEMVEAMTNKQIDILVGTQMLTKGYHFPNLDFVGVVDGDLGLDKADLRGVERTYQLLTQVAGRAGREGAKGKVLIQTYQSHALIMQCLKEMNKSRFLDIEIETRKKHSVPPFGKYASITIENTKQELALKYAKQFMKLAPIIEGVQLLGPAPAYIAKLMNKHRYKILVKAIKSINIQKYINSITIRLKLPQSVNLRIDIDPYNLI